MMATTITSSASVLQFIRSNLPLAAVPSLPEILLHTAGPQSGLWRLAESEETFGTPYWAYVWGGGLALARHVLDHPRTVAGRVVLDLGTGSGIVAIAAAKSGAKSVLAADIDRYAVMATSLNAAANGVTIATHLGDLTAGLPPAVDAVLVGDLFYEGGLAERVTDFLDRCVRADIQVLVGDPWRNFLPRTRLRLVAEYPGTDFGSGVRDRQSRNAVFSFEMVRSRGLEPPRVAPLAPQASASTNSATTACGVDARPSGRATADVTVQLLADKLPAA
jgi:predicted nicotinamide N-methyase